jgi:hypothetical protein
MSEGKQGNGRGMGARDPRRPENQDAMRRQERAYALFIGGATFPQIAASPDPERGGKPLYSDKGSAYKAVQRAIERHTGFDEVEEMRRVENLRLDALQRAHWAKALRGSGWDTDRVLAIMDQRARLNGLRAPERKQIEVLTTDTVQAAIDQLTREIAEEDAMTAALAADPDLLNTDGDPIEQGRS